MIGIINYGLGNVRAFVNVYNQLDIPCCLVSSPNELDGLSHIILPGVGSFDFAMEALERCELVDALHHAVCVEKKPILGVCVGMQIMARGSEEGRKAGLGWLDTQVNKIASSALLPVPHMGWNRVQQIGPSPVFEGIKQGSEFYFLHSFGFVADQNGVVATAKYVDEIGVVIHRSNIIGIQCHPEKSHSPGIRFLENFARCC